MRAAALVLAVLALPAAALSPQAAPARRPWAEVAAPAILALGPAPDEPGKLVLSFRLVTGSEGADKAVVEMSEASGKVLESRLVGKAKSEERQVEFQPQSSGDYSFRVVASRTGEPAAKSSESRSLAFTLPLAAPEPVARNLGAGRLAVTWKPVREAEAYELRLIPPGDRGANVTRRVEGPGFEVEGLAVGARYGLVVAALRGGGRAESKPVATTIRAEAEREWHFTWFGQSTKAELNTFRMLDADDPSFVLDSCSVLADGQVDQKGGKFTAFHDGISYYYTVIDPRRENFELSATFTVEYLNPQPDGQEGFGLLAMDSLGERGVSARNHYTNSAGVIATKFEAVVDGAKRTSKDTVGARFVSGITPEVLSLGDSGIAQRGSSVSRAFSHGSSELVRAGSSYRLRLAKTNTGYEASWLDCPLGGARDYVMYGPEKLLMLDPDHVYVGFAVARGCRVRVSGVSLRTSDPATDPPARPEPAEAVPLVARVDSPRSFHKGSYPFVFAANADGLLDLSEGRTPLLRGARVRAGEDFRRSLELGEGNHELSLLFTPDPAYSPGQGKILTRHDPGLGAEVPATEPLYLSHSVVVFAYDLPELRVSPTGSFLGKGTAEDPLDLETALFFSKPGQPIVLAGGLYRPTRPLVIPRGSDGEPGARKVLRSAAGERAVLDFSWAGGGMQLWGDYWILEDLEIRATPDNVKGLQVGGSRNVLSRLVVHGCGDTGLQISGSSAEPPAAWPRDNLVAGCLSYGNKDPAANNADGFAAKLSAGEGNVFRSCVAYGNIDDGWDLFAKIESGPIGAVLIEGCVSYANGSLPGSSAKGDGNGFKLGGDGIAVPHVIRNSIAFDNGAAGITSNSNPAIVVERCTSYGNGGRNFAFYGKGDGSRRFVASGNVSMRGGAADDLAEMPSLASPDNWFWNGARCANSLGEALGPDLFASTDLRVAPRMRPDGTIDMGGLLEPLGGRRAGVGAHIR